MATRYIKRPVVKCLADPLLSRLDLDLFHKSHTDIS